jgi:uncharacterized surface protein with fasciclin (FAS1) repeats
MGPGYGMPFSFGQGPGFGSGYPGGFYGMPRPPMPFERTPRRGPDAPAYRSAPRGPGYGMPRPGYGMPRGMMPGYGMPQQGMMPGYGRAPQGQPGAMAPGMGQAMSMQDLVEKAKASKQFETLIQAVQAAGLVETLKGEGPFTVFAPKDSAFAKLPEGKLEALLDNPDELAKVLKYHVVSGVYPAQRLAGLDQVTSVEGSNIPLTRTTDGVQAAGAAVVVTNIRTSNGIIHVVDSVLLPPEEA